VDLFVGGSPTEHPERYAEADPLALLPCPTPTVLVHGADDDVVPLSQSQEYAAASQARHLVVPGGHYEHLDPSTEAVEALLEALGPAAAAVGG
jgi:pimeloyl-ACP methyl ester carboxylesterase